MEHLALEIFDRNGSGSKFATLPEDTTITIIVSSAVFGSGDIWSYSFTLNVRANAHIFGSAGDMHGSRLHDQIDKRRARLWVDGIPLYLGYLALGEEAEVDGSGNVSVTFESGNQTFNDMIDGAKANQVPMMGDVMFGVALWRKRKVDFDLRLIANAVFEDGSESQYAEVLASNGSPHIRFQADGQNGWTSVQEYPRMVFPKGEFVELSGNSNVSVNCLNTDYPYDEGHPYCNVALCYQRYGYEKKDELGNIVPDYNSDPEAQRGYEVMPADRVNSAPNFYVIYWIRALMKHLGIHIEENQMMDVEDLRRLFFVNTKCAYRLPEKIRGNSPDSGFTRYQFKSTRQGGRRIYSRLVAEQFVPHDGNGWHGPCKAVNTEESKFTCTSFSYASDYSRHGPDDDFEAPNIKGIKVKVSEAYAWSDSQKDGYEGDNSYLHDAYATSECFPDVDISEVIKAMESGFGIRFLFSDDYKRVRIVLLRSIFTSDKIQHIGCEILSDAKVENNIRGFRMTYGKTGDTHFYYKGFGDKLPHKKELWQDNSDTHDYSQWDLNTTYANLLNRITAFNKTCFVTPINGNAYGIKVDKDAKRYEELHPSLFEYAGFMDAEDGDCTGDEETIETVTVGFTPAIMNDLNMEDERSGRVSKQRFALFVDEQMRARRPSLVGDAEVPASDAPYSTETMYAKFGPNGTDGNMTHGDGVVAPGEFAIASDIPVGASGLNFEVLHTFAEEASDTPVDTHYEEHPVRYNVAGINISGHINEGYRLYLQDNYEPNDDGVCPVETHDWGLTLGIMRGSGGDASISYTPDPRDVNDGLSNDTWELIPGSNISSHPDTCDNYGNLWAYHPERYVDASYLRAAGWDVGDAEGMIPYTHEMVIYDMHILCTPIKYVPDGFRPDADPVLSQSELESYISELIDEYYMDFEEFDRYRLVLSVKYDNGSTLYADGRISLKLRAEKPNPYFDPSLPENATNNRRYLNISKQQLRNRGLADTMYKEYSYWVRNARIAKRTLRMELAQLISIDTTVRATVGDITGFIKQMKFQVSNRSGLGVVESEIMYI